jgi:hypothetical protein
MNSNPRSRQSSETTWLGIHNCWKDLLTWSYGPLGFLGGDGPRGVVGWPPCLCGRRFCQMIAPARHMARRVRLPADYGHCARSSPPFRPWMSVDGVGATPLVTTCVDTQRASALARRWHAMLRNYGWKQSSRGTEDAIRLGGQAATGFGPTDRLSAAL